MHVAYYKLRGGDLDYVGLADQDVDDSVSHLTYFSFGQQFPAL